MVTMKAVAVRAFRGVPELMDLPRPTPKRGEVLVRMSAAGVNPFDRKLVDGMLEGQEPHVFPLILGADGAGTVDKLGEGAHRFLVGDQIYGQFFHSPVGTGTYAEYCAVPEGIGVGRIPPSIDAIHAAAAPTAGMTALVLLEGLGLSKGQTLLIVGATGGVGSFATEIAARRGIHVIATASEESKAFVESLGASEVIDYRKLSVPKTVLQNHPDGVDGLLDSASNAEGFAENARAVRRGGSAVTSVGAADPPSLQGKGIRAANLGLESSTSILERLSRAIEKERIRVPVETIVPLAEAPEAFARLRQGGARGKTVIRISE